MVLVKEESPLAAKYDNKSVAEQNSVDLVWGFLMSPEYVQLRACICCDQEEFERFRSLVVNCVMAVSTSTILTCRVTCSYHYHSLKPSFASKPHTRPTSWTSN